MAIQRNPNEVAYSFIKYRDTQEVHIFEGRFTPEGCTAKKDSICKKIEDRHQEDVQNVKSCQDENEARLYAANKGRDVCGICVSHLYTTYEE